MSVRSRESEGVDQQTRPAPAVAPPWWHRPLRVTGSAVAALTVAAFPSFSWRSALAVIGLGTALCWWGLARGSGRCPEPVPGRAALWWLLPTVLLGGVELASFLLGSTPAHPTLSALADPVLEHYWLRAAACAGWLAGFWALVRR